MRSRLNQKDSWRKRNAIHKCKATMQNTVQTTARKSARSIWILALVLAGLVVACGREQALTPPAPLVTSTVPANGATGVPTAHVITANFNQTMDATTITASTFTVAGPSGAVTGTVTYSGTTATFTPAAPLAATTLYTAAITTGAKNPAGTALASNFVWTFTTGTIPTVTSTNPLSAATNAPINKKIIATFSEPMNSATVTATGTFSVVVTAGGAAVPGTVTYVSATNTAMFAPTANLLASTQYIATITTAAQSAAGNALASNRVWSFTTGTTADTTHPTVTSSNPASAATAVPTNQTITATFSKVMDSATVTASGTFTVAVAGAGGAAVPGTVSYANSTAVFTPTANLTANTQYTATITNAAKDLSGNALVAGAVPNPWNFTTGAGPNTTAPTITLAVAGAGGAAVAGNVTYDSASNIATFTPAANLTASTQYTATIATAAKDLAGNALAAGSKPNPWTFTTCASVGPTAPNLGTASTFGAFGGGAYITNQVINTIIN